MRTPITLPAILMSIVLLALPASALANGTDDRIFEDCQYSPTGALQGSYPKGQLNHALNNIPGDVSEYSGCYDAIKQALLATGGSHGGGGNDGGGSDAAGAGGIGGIGGGPGSGTAGSGGGPVNAAGGGSAPEATPPAGAEQPVEVAGTAVTPGALPEIGQDSHRIPAPLLVLLALLGIGALATTALTIGPRVVARHRA